MSEFDFPGTGWLQRDNDLRYVARVLSPGSHPPQEDRIRAYQIIQALRTRQREPSIEYVALLSRVWEAAGGTRDQLPINDEMQHTVLSLVRDLWMQANEVQDITGDK